MHSRSRTRRTTCKLLRELVGPDATIISKIESKRGVRNIDEILAETDEILIDRGDLSREVPLENLPLLQKAIIRKANIAKVPVNVATNLLESMIVNRKPTRAELNDIVNTMLDGANGLVLAAETAIGSHPVGAVDMVLGLIERYRRSLEGYRIEDLLEGGSVLLPSLHGRSRVRQRDAAEVDAYFRGEHSPSFRGSKSTSKRPWTSNKSPTAFIRRCADS